MSAPVRIGTCSFADESLSRYWYPKGVRAGDRLRYYAERFDTVEIDSTFYRLPEAETCARWVERTPPGFVFHVKAFAPMTRHPVRLEQLPADLRDSVEVGRSGRVERPPREVRGEIFRRFHEALEPIRAAGKLGGILLQFPPYVVPKPSSYEYLEWASEQLDGDEMLVEFRHRDWLEEGRRVEVFSFLEGLRAALVIVDSPRGNAKSLLPTLVVVTGATAYVRLHGRNSSTWHVRGRSAAERFDYLYSSAELEEWIEPLRTLTQESEEVYVFFNNNGRSSAPPSDSRLPGVMAGANGDDEWVAQAPTNAVMLRRLLRAAGLPVIDPGA